MTRHVIFTEVRMGAAMECVLTAASLVPDKMLAGGAQSKASNVLARAEP